MQSQLNKKIIVLGDSHIQVFSHPSFSQAFPNIEFKRIVANGATVSGLENPNSNTQAYHVFYDALECEEYDKIVVMLGEVDTGFVIWYRAQKYGADIYKMLQKAITNYEQFILKLTEYKDIIVISTPLPTIQDNNNWGEVANLRKEIRIKQKDRTALTLKFNSAMNNFCLKNRIDFLNLDNESLGDNGLVKNSFLNKDLTDHHYDSSEYAKLIINKMKHLLS